MNAEYRALDLGNVFGGITLNIMSMILSKVKLWMKPSICKSPEMVHLSQDDVMTLEVLIVRRAKVAAEITELHPGRQMTR